MEDRLKVIKLPSGSEAKIVTFLTRGEVKNIEKARWGGAEVASDESGEVLIKNIPMTQTLLEQDALVLQGTKRLDGKEFSKKLLEEMPSRDFNFLLLELEKVQGKSEIKKAKSATS